MSTSDVFQAFAQSLEYTFLANAGPAPTWTPRWGFVTYELDFDPRFKIGGQFGGWWYGVRAYAGHGAGKEDFHGNTEAKRGPQLNGYSEFAGVLGTGVHVTGVAGTSIESVGVYGQAGETPVSLLRADHVAGVIAVSNSVEGVGVYGQRGVDPRPSIPKYLAGVVGVSTKAPGVSGWSESLAGVEGRSDQYAGVLGSSSGGIGVYGTSGQSLAVVGASQFYTGVMGWSGVLGPEIFPGFSTTPGVFGTSRRQAGVVGTSDQLMGVYGYSTGNAGVVGQSGSPNSYGGYFFGNVRVTGALTVEGDLALLDSAVAAKIKNAVVPFPDGTHRLLHCMESPEHWFEDFGAAKLKRGRALVKIDANFAKVIKRGDYRVFVTPEGDCRGLYVRRKQATSFEVREFARGKSSVAFSYRIVGRRKDIGRHTRFAKIDTRLDTRLTLPAAARRPRKGAPSAARLRAFVARLNKEAREHRAKRGRSRARPKQPPAPLYVRRPQPPKNIRRRAPNPHVL